MEIISFSSSKGAISVGVNFNPMYRHKIFKHGPLKEFCAFKLKEAAQMYGKKYQFRLDEVGLDIDHAHVLVTFGPNTKLCDVIKKLKEHSAKEIFNKSNSSKNLQPNFNSRNFLTCFKKKRKKRNPLKEIQSINYIIYILFFFKVLFFAQLIQLNIIIFVNPLFLHENKIFSKNLFRESNRQVSNSYKHSE